VKHSTLKLELLVVVEFASHIGLVSLAGYYISLVTLMKTSQVLVILFGVHQGPGTGSFC
jgi:hypothetical protein